MFRDLAVFVQDSFPFVAMSLAHVCTRRKAEVSGVDVLAELTRLKSEVGGCVDRDSTVEYSTVVCSTSLEEAWRTAKLWGKDRTSPPLYSRRCISLTYGFSYIILCWFSRRRATTVFHPFSIDDF